jgi:hypothetical protein
MPSVLSSARDCAETPARQQARESTHSSARDMRSRAGGRGGGCESISFPTANSPSPKLTTQHPIGAGLLRRIR